jgi:hypothetical protein
MKVDQDIFRAALIRQAVRLRIPNLEFHAVALGVDETNQTEMFSISFPGGSGEGPPEKLLDVMRDASTVNELIENLRCEGLSRFDATN